MKSEQQKPIDFDKIAASESFKKLSRKKNIFLWTFTSIFLALYLLLPILTSYTDILDKKAVGEITWVWFYSLGLFIMTWSFAHYYVKKANAFDKQAKEIIEEYERGAQNE